MATSPGSAPSSPATKSPSWSLRSGLRAVETAAKGVLLVGGALYALGFVVVALHQARYGIVVTGLLRAQYVLAGIWLLVPGTLVIMITGLTIHFFTLGKRTIKSDKWKSLRLWRKILAFVLLIGGVPSVVATSWNNVSLLLNTGVKEIGFGPISWKALLQMASPGLVLLVFVLPVLRWQGYWEKHQEMGIRRLLARNLDDVFTDSVIVVCVAVFYCAFFTTRTYARIPAQFGGGASREARFLFLNGRPAPAFLQADSTGYESIPYTVVLETDRSFVVRSMARQQQVMEFSRSEIAGTVGLTPVVKPTPKKASAARPDSAGAPSIASPQPDSTQAAPSTPPSAAPTAPHTGQSSKAAHGGASPSRPRS